MSNGLAIATVTASLAEQITGLISKSSAGVTGAYTRCLQPSNASLANGDPIVNVFLYRVTTAAELAGVNTTAPGVRPAASPRVAVNLDYLISFHGDETTLVPQRLLAVVAAGLYAQPILSPNLMKDVSNKYTWLEGTDLFRQVEPIKLIASPPMPDDVAWVADSLDPGGHRLTLQYRATAVYLAPDSLPS